MRKIHVITQKEVVEPEKLQNCSVVVLDVFLATSTIVMLLQQNAQMVYAVDNAHEAVQLTKQIEGSYLLLGELNGEALEGFDYPDPSSLTFMTEPTSAIICSTNGTRAIQKARLAKRLFISSIINGHAVAKVLEKQTDESSIVLICSGNNGRLSLEDLVGAGHIIDHLLKTGSYQLSDAAKLAQAAFIQALASKFENLRDCETAKLLEEVHFEQSIDFVIKQFENSTVVPYFDGIKINHLNEQLQNS